MNVSETKAGDIFLAATALAGDARARFIETEAGADEELRTEVEALLRADEKNDAGFLTRPALGAGFSVLTAPQGGESHEKEPNRPGRIGPYHTLEVLAESDDVIVWLAEQREPVARRVAIKVLRSAAVRRSVLKRFELERRAVALMEHPNIARLYDAGTTLDGRAYFAMEHVDGPPLTAACATLGVRARLELFVQACLGVEHAHQRGIIHRDLKPANVLVSRQDGAPARVKVIDFGVAAAIRAGMEERTGLTLQGQVVGTPGYMAPERLKDGEHDSGLLVDVYSLGAVLHEILAGRPAFSLEGKGTAAAIAAVLTERPARLGDVDRGLRGDLEAIAATAMKPELSERYQSVAELRRDVERYLAGKPVTARMPGPVYIAQKFVGRHKTLTLVSAAALMVAGAAMWRAQSAERDRCELAAEIAGSWLEQTVRMARTIGERDKRRPLLERLAQESARFEAIAPNDVRIQQIHASVLGSLGDVAQEESRLTEAGALWAEALRVRERVVGLRPKDVNAEMDRSIALVRCGDVLCAGGDREQGLDLYKRAMALDRAVVSRVPKNARAVNNLAWSCHRLGAWAVGSSQLDTADALLNEGLVFMWQVVSLRGNVDDVRGIADMHSQLSHLAGARERAGDREQGAVQRHHLLASLMIADSAREMASDNRLAQQQWLRSTMEYVSVCGADVEGRSSRQAWPRVLDEMRRFVQLDASDRDSQILLYSAYSCALQTAKGTGDVEFAGLMIRQLDADLCTVLAERQGDEELTRVRAWLTGKRADAMDSLGLPH